MTATQLAFGVGPVDTDDPHAEARRLVREAIATTAVLHGGRVSANAVRPRLAHLGIPPKVVGQVYAALRREGRLVEDGIEKSDDVRGGNRGRWISRYRWVDAP